MDRKMRLKISCAFKAVHTSIVANDGIDMLACHTFFVQCHLIYQSAETNQNMLCAYIFNPIYRANTKWKHADTNVAKTQSYWYGINTEWHSCEPHAIHCFAMLMESERKRAYTSRAVSQCVCMFMYVAAVFLPFDITK